MITKQKKHIFSKKNISNLPEEPGVYIFWSGKKPLYVGKSINLRSRLRSYKLITLSAKTQKMISLVKYFSYIKVTSEIESLLLEAKLVHILKTPFNIQLKDDKHPLYIHITKDKYPMVLTARKAKSKDKKDIYFGPFPSSISVKKTLSFLRKIFPYSQHLPSSRACIYSQMNLCNPCPSEIEKETDLKIKSFKIKKYLKNILFIKRFLNGDLKKIIKVLYKEMDNKVTNEAFEDAKEIKNQIQALEYITKPQNPVTWFLLNPNLSEDLKKDELKELKYTLSKYLDIKNISRIECYDVAHLSGTFPTASMVTFIDGVPEKSYYRHFNIKQVNSRNDISNMEELAKRRIKHFDDWGKPDLIIVDGGKGQINVFKNQLKETNIPIIGVAKGTEILVIPIKNSFVSLKIRPTPMFNLVVRMRDEAHRFARRLHHKLVERNILQIG